MMLRGYLLALFAPLAVLASAYLLFLILRVSGGFRKGRRVILTGGGTGGHVYPALAIGAALDDGETRILYIGVKGKAEASLVPRSGYGMRFVRASAYSGLRPSTAALGFLVNTSVGTLQALVQIGLFQPHVIVGTGGYASAPVFFAAALLRAAGLSGARLYIHEQNAVPGKLNGLVGRFSDVVFLSFPETLAQFPGKGVVTGYPVRKTMVKLPREEAVARLGLQVPAGRTIVFVFGGSQGARSINRAVAESLRELLPLKESIYLIHGTGLQRGGGYDGEADTAERMKALYSEKKLSEFERFYHHRPYFHDIQAAYSASDLVVCRAGAGSLNEIGSMGLPAVVVPKAGLPGDHQVMNARALACSGGAVLLYEEVFLDGGQVGERLSGKALADAISGLVTDPQSLARMAERARVQASSDAASMIADIVAERRKPAVCGPSDAEKGAANNGLLGNDALMRLLGSEEKKRGRDYRPEDFLDLGDMEYYRVRAAAMLGSKSWAARNNGVKQIGLLRDAGRLPLLLHLLADRTPASFIERAFGGDFRQVGFIRRNVVHAIGRIGVLEKRVEGALMLALADPYYEVRVEAARAVAAFGTRFEGRGALAEVLESLLSDRNHEVASAAAEALGKVGSGSRDIERLLSLKDHRFWQVREAGLKGLRSLVERGEVEDPAGLLKSASKFILTSVDFRPHFTIKESFRLLAGTVAKRAGE